MSYVWGGNVKIKTIFSEEEIDGLLDIYNSTDMRPVQSDQNLKQVFITPHSKKNHFTKKIHNTEVEECYFVEYPIGAFCVPHQDAKIIDGRIINENITTITLLSDDYEGGASVVGDQTFKPKKGETVFYDPDELHGVEEITSGSRIVYVVWYRK